MSCAEGWSEMSDMDVLVTQHRQEARWARIFLMIWFSLPWNTSITLHMFTSRLPSITKHSTNWLILQIKPRNPPILYSWARPTPPASNTHLASLRSVSLGKQELMPLTVQQGLRYHCLFSPVAVWGWVCFVSINNYHPTWMDCICL